MPHEWWQARVTAYRNLRLVEASIVLHCRTRDHQPLWLERLHYRPAWNVGPARASYYLRYQLESALRRPVTRDSKTRICRQDTNESDAWDVQTFRYHLSPDQYLGTVSLELLKDASMLLGVPRGV